MLLQAMLLGALAASAAGGGAAERTGRDGSGYVYGPFGGEVTYARGPLGGEAEHRVPGRMRVAPGAGEAELSLVKFILVETGDENVAGFEEGFVEMGGFVAFAVEPVGPPPAEGDPNRRAAVLWKGIEVLLPGFADRPRTLTGGGELGGAWKLNLLLEREVFDPLWQDARKAEARPPAGPAGPRHRLVPQMAVTLVYRDHRELEPGERRELAVDADRFRGAFEAIHAASGGRLALDPGAVTATMRDLVRRGVVGGLEAEDAETASEALLSGLFGAIRQRWLEYGLEPEAGSARARLVARLLRLEETKGGSLVFSPGEWVPVERARRMDVEIETGACDLETMTRHGFARETRLSLEFLPRGDWSGSEVSRVLMLYDVAAGGRVLDFGKVIVRLDAFEPRLEVIKSVDQQNVRLRTKVGGFWRRDGGGRERFVRLAGAEWHDTQATLRRHFHFILPEDLEPGTSGVNQGHEPRP